MKHNIFILFSLLAILASCGDDLASTYGDFTDGKPIHYAGKVKDVSVSPGWQCLRATWTLSNDPAVKNIIVTCASESDTIQQTLDPTATSCKIDNLSNKDYTIKVQSLDTDGSLSLAGGVVSRHVYLRPRVGTCFYSWREQGVPRKGSSAAYHGQLGKRYRGFPHLFYSDEWH